MTEYTDVRNNTYKIEELSIVSDGEHWRAAKEAAEELRAVFERGINSYAGR